MMLCGAGHCSLTQPAPHRAVTLALAMMIPFLRAIGVPTPVLAGEERIAPAVAAVPAPAAAATGSLPGGFSSRAFGRTAVAPAEVSVVVTPDFEADPDSPARASTQHEAHPGHEGPGGAPQAGTPLGTLWRPESAAWFIVFIQFFGAFVYMCMWTAHMYACNVALKYMRIYTYRWYHITKCRICFSNVPIPFITCI